MCNAWCILRKCCVVLIQSYIKLYTTLYSVRFEILTVVLHSHQMTQWHFSEDQNSDCFTVYGRLFYMHSEHWLWICIVSYQEGKIRKCMFMWWQNGEHRCPSEGANSICLAHTGQIIAHYVFKQMLSLCTQKSTIQLAGLEKCSMCSARLFWYLINSCECQWTNIMCGLVEHDFSLLMQEFCDSFEICEIWTSQSGCCCCCCCCCLCCRFKTSGIWHCVKGQVAPEISRELMPFFFVRVLSVCLTLKFKALHSIKTSITVHAATQNHIPELLVFLRFRAVYF